MTRLISELLDLPERVHRGDFVLNLSTGVQEPQKTAESYVVTPQLERAFSEALEFIRSAIDTRTSKATYLHGSFGSGKSHFMAILYLLLQNHSAVTRMRELAAVCAASSWRTEKKCLLIPYHMIGAQDMESAILGGYVDFVRRLHRDAPIPGVYRADALLRDADEHRRNYGDERFFELLNRSSGESGWGDIDSGWDATRYATARHAPPGSEERSRLISDMIKQLFPSYETVARGRRESFVSLDDGLSIISHHAQSLGYDGLILFLDELILWLASHAADLGFVHQEGQKLAKLVESQASVRPVPIVSFVARQRDLRDLVGPSITGVEQLNFADALKHWEGRFHKIVLEDRNLPVIAEKRVLRPRNDAARAELDQAFRETEKVRKEVMDTLLTRDADRAMFRKVYPFSPALVQCLVAVSSALQRERTALKIMLQLLVDKRDTLEVGEVVPVGDLWDQVAQGEEAFVEGMHHQFEMARRLWSRKLCPMLEADHGLHLEHDLGRAKDDREVRARLARFEKDARLLKTLLLAAIVPEEESLKNLVPARLAALNHGSIKAPFPGREGQIVLDKLRRWASRVGEIRIEPESANPVVSLQLLDVDVDAVIESATIQDSPPNRQRKLRQLLFEAMGIADRDGVTVDHEFIWRGTRRECTVSFFNVRDAVLSSFENEDKAWKVIIDFPFDASGCAPRDDLSRLDEFRSGERSARTLVWLPDFFSRQTQTELGRLVIVEYLLRGDNLEQHSKQLSIYDRTAARQLLEGLRHTLTQKVQMALEAAYGLRNASPGTLDNDSELGAEKFQSLERRFQPQPPHGANFKQALEGFLGQALAWEFPKHPEFGREVKKSELQKILDVARKANRDPNRRVHVEDKKVREILSQVADPLELGRMRDNIFVLSTTWADRFTRHSAQVSDAKVSVLDLRRWTDTPELRGLLREVQDLLILVYADQTQQSFHLHGAPIQASVGEVSDEAELRPFQGPSEEEWRAAREVAAKGFGVAVSELLDPDNLNSMAIRVSAVLNEHGRHARELPGLVKQVLISLGMSENEVMATPRYRTALAVAELVESAPEKDSTELVRAIAVARIETSAAAMGTSLKFSGVASETLDSGKHDIFNAVGEIDQIAGARIRGRVRDVLAADEYDQRLDPRWIELQAEALKVLRGKKQEKESRDATESGTFKGLDAAGIETAARELIEKLKADDGGHRLDIDWRLYRMGGAS